MKTHWLRCAALVAALALAGCRGQPTVDPDVAPVDESTRLGDSTDVDLAAWLKLPRADLAKLADEWTTTLKTQREVSRNDTEATGLLPRFLPPLTVPGFHEAKYAPAVGFSLPPYAEPGKKDAALAVHLARLGDHEAAVKLADPGDASLLERLGALQTKKNYPVEWTRLVGLVLISAQHKVTTGDVDGATQLVLLHKQLGELLDSKAAAGPLGAALLPQGKRVLDQAAKAWRDPKRNKTALAGDVEEAVTAWGNVPVATPALSFPASSAEVAGLLGVAQRGKAVMADKPASVDRAVDLLGLPINRDGVEVVTAFLDKDDRLASWLIGYEAKIDTFYPELGQLVYGLVEAGAVAGAEKKDASLATQDFVSGGLRWEVVRATRSPALGGLVRIVPEKNALTASRTRSLRDFGPVHLDRGFEACRLLLAPRQAAPSILVRDEARLKGVGASLDTPAPTAVALHRDSKLDVVTGMEMSWKPDENSHALSRLLPAIWDDYGPSVVGAVEDAAGSYLTFTWHDGTTQVQLRLAYDERGPVLVVRDTQAADKLPARLAKAQQQDEKERQARLASSAANVRLGRSPGIVNDFSLEELQLGQPRQDALAALPTGKSYRRVNVPGGVSLTVLNAPPSNATWWLRQVMLRFDASDNLNEVRLRYVFGPSSVKKGATLLDQLTDARSGSPESVPARWAGLWTDQPGSGRSVSYRWRDDRTVREYNEDVGGAEVVLFARPGDSPSLDAGPWRFVSTGVKGVSLGDTRAAVRAALKLPAARSGGADVHRMPAATPYEMVLVWYEGDRVSRVMAVHRDRPKEPKDAEGALTRAWGRDIDSLGYIRRREGQNGPILRAYFWNDDQVRVQTSVQTNDHGLRVMSEWRTWPIPVATKPDPTKARAGL